MSQPTKTALAVLTVAIAAGAFWLLLIAPKREQADELSEQISAARSSLAVAQQGADAGLAAKRDFPRDYQQLVLLGKAVPADSGTASLLVQLNEISRHNHTPFVGINLDADAAEEGGEGEAVADVASLPPLGSRSGPAGLQAMPYELDFEGGYFDTADFIGSVHSLVRTKNGRVRADGRLITFDYFEMAASKSTFKPRELAVKFYVTAYTTSAGQGLTAGATSAGPAPE